MAERIFERLSIRRNLETVPNEAAQIIEQAYGIPFREVPLLAPLTRRNSVLLGISELKANPRYIPLMFLANIFGDRKKSRQAEEITAAYYDARLNTCFTNPKHQENEGTLLHENAHALTAFLNPQAFGRETMSIISDGPELVEANLVIGCVSEGISEWVEVDILLNSDDQEKRSLAYKTMIDNSLVAPLATSKEQLTVSRYLSYQFSKLDEIKDRLVNALASRGKRKAVEIASAADDFFLESTPYMIGYFYVHFAMKRLVEYYKMSKSDALVFVTQNLPKVFSELHSPEVFVDKIQQKLQKREFTAVL